MLAVVHGGGLIQRYRSYPTRVQLDVSNRQGIPLPAVTVCPLDRFDVNRLQLLWRQTIVAFNDSNSTGPEPEPTEMYYQLAGLLPVDELWNKIAFPNARALFPMVIYFSFFFLSQQNIREKIWLKCTNFLERFIPNNVY